jgi:molybdate-binding protein/transcriptional regulator with XRE-family HTH domain
VNNGTRLRLARQARGFSQQQLAGMAGVTRQAVSAVESGQSDPSLRVALALAQALGLRVDELFGAEGAVPTLPADVVSTGSATGLGSGARVTLAPIADSLVAFPLTGLTASRAGFLPADALVVAEPAAAEPAGAEPAGAEPAGAEPAGAEPAGAEPAGAEPGDTELGGAVAGARRVRVRPIGPPRPTVVIAGCDPALPLLSEPLGLLDPPIALRWWPCASEEALRLAAAGLVHVAGVHLSGGSASGDIGPVADLLAGGGEVIGFSAWREGLVLRPEHSRRITSLADVISAGLRLVNREPGAEARSVLDRELAVLRIAGDEVPGYGTRASGHLQVAEAIAAGLADVGVASEPAALAYGLAFIPLTAERFDLVIPARQLPSREVQALIKVLTSRWLLDQLASLPGYDPSPCGRHVARLSEPASRPLIPVRDSGRCD